MRKTKQAKLSTGFLVLVGLLFIVTSLLVSAPPTPHNIQGFVYTDSGTGVHNGVPVFINDTTQDTTAYTEILAPPFNRGFYALTIVGEDGDAINVTAWNGTHYGVNHSTLISPTTTVNVVIQHERPSETNVTIWLPLNGTSHNIGVGVNVSANISVIVADGTSCFATIDFSPKGIANISAAETFTHSLGNINQGETVITSWNVTGLSGGATAILVDAYCASDGINIEGVDHQFINITINDVQPPIIQLVSPANNSWLNTPNISLFYNVSDPSGIANCSLYYNGTLNHTVHSPLVNTRNNFTINNTNEGYYEWLVSCTDASSNANEGNSSFYNVRIDYSPLSVALISPANNTRTPNNTIVFTYLVNGTFSVNNCSLFFNDSFYAINTSPTLDTNNAFNITRGGGTFEWRVNCTDNATNVGSSAVFFINITDPDLFINGSFVVLSNANPVEKENVSINATVFNIGNENATNAVIRVFEGNPEDGEQLGSDYVRNISFGSNVTLEFTYKTIIGETPIVVVVDPPLSSNGSIRELVEDNNKGNETIVIALYHTYYGPIDSNVFLDTSSNQSVFDWNDATALSGNIFVADTDSSVNFNTLKALGRNVSNNLSLDDFEELDVVFNTTNLTDSINRTYVDENGIKEVDNFTIYETLIESVPVVNSTNSSVFVSGIVWDTSDTNPGEFNTSQDLIFITHMVRNGVGFYGTYDYEIRVPARLRQYIVPDASHSVTFYHEIT